MSHTCAPSARSYCRKYPCIWWWSTIWTSRPTWHTPHSMASHPIPSIFLACFRWLATIIFVTLLTVCICTMGPGPVPTARGKIVTQSIKSLMISSPGLRRLCSNWAHLRMRSSKGLTMLSLMTLGKLFNEFIANMKNVLVREIASE